MEKNSFLDLKERYLCAVLIYSENKEGNVESLSLTKVGNNVLPYMMNYDPFDLNFFQQVKREVREVLGFNIQDINKWNYLGHITSEVNGVNIPCFCVEISETERASESKIELLQVPFTQIYKHNDVYLSGILFKFLKKVIEDDTRKESKEETSEEAGVQKEEGIVQGMERENDKSTTVGQ